jgi:cysteine synthase A
MIKNSTLELIGNTPLLELSKIHKGPGKIFVKAEFLQPGGSVKDRAAKKIIELAYKNGKLKKGQPVVEMTSGNMGAGLAIVCNILGNPFIAIMSEGNSTERAKMMKNLSAEIVLTKQVEGTPGKVTGKDIKVATEKAKEIAADKNAFYVDQFNNVGSVLAHYEGTGLEIWQSLNGELDAFVASVGSGGTFTGCSRYFKLKNRDILCAVVEPKGCEILAGKEITKCEHLLQGTGYSLIPPHWEKSITDVYLSVSDEEATEYKNLLAKKEGLYVGYSSAANVCAAIKLLKSEIIENPDPKIVTILCDTGLKY